MIARIAEAIERLTGRHVHVYDKPSELYYYSKEVSYCRCGKMKVEEH